MDIQQRILRFVVRANWTFLAAAGLCSALVGSPGMTRGILFGGLIVTVNFHLLARTLHRAFQPRRLGSPNTVLAKYYLRFLVSAAIIFLLISQKMVNPVGLFIGLSIVVASIMVATLREITLLFFKEAT